MVWTCDRCLLGSQPIYLKVYRILLEKRWLDFSHTSAPARGQAAVHIHSELFGCSSQFRWTGPDHQAAQQVWFICSVRKANKHFACFNTKIYSSMGQKNKKRFSPDSNPLLWLITAHKMKTWIMCAAVEHEDRSGEDILSLKYKCTCSTVPFYSSAINWTGKLWQDQKTKKTKVSCCSFFNRHWLSISTFSREQLSWTPHFKAIMWKRYSGKVWISSSFSDKHQQLFFVQGHQVFKEYKLLSFIQVKLISSHTHSWILRKKTIIKYVF